jgi:8-oxo-dGTP pyrophosphatase MutT (NUDIX family)
LGQQVPDDKALESRSQEEAQVVRYPRPAARILLLDRANRVLLFRFDPDDRPPFWCTPGGALDPGETHTQAARRELLEETGIDADPGPEVEQRMCEFVTIEGYPVIADERYFLLQLDIDERKAPVVDTSRHTELERKVMRSWRWFDRAELETIDELVFPEDLFGLIDTVLAAGTLP